MLNRIDRCCFPRPSLHLRTLSIVVPNRANYVVVPNCANCCHAKPSQHPRMPPIAGLNLADRHRRCCKLTSNPLHGPTLLIVEVAIKSSRCNHWASLKPHRHFVPSPDPPSIYCLLLNAHQIWPIATCSSDPALVTTCSLDPTTTFRFAASHCSPDLTTIFGSIANCYLLTQIWPPQLGFTLSPLLRSEPSSPRSNNPILLWLLLSSDLTHP